MNLENLESLLLDRALGELPPAVAELLDEHLARDPSAAQQAAAFTATLQLARRAAAVPAAASLPPLATTRLRQAERQMRWWSHLGELAKLAACVALGLVFGRAAWPESTPARPQVAVRTVTPASLPAPDTKFWSLASVADGYRGRSARPGPGYQLRWESPLKMPRVEEKP